jgi:hypothetical protein
MAGYARKVTDPATGAVSYVDATGAPVAPPASTWVADDDAFVGYSPGDLQRAQAQGAEQTAVAAGIGGLGSAAQFALLAAPTAMDKENNKRLGELALHKGLSGGERADIDEQAMRGVRALATESQARDESALAASGQHSAASLQRARASNADALNRASIQAADIGIEANRAKVAADTQEEQERIRAKGERQKQTIEMAGQTLAGLLQAAAPAVAAAAVPTAPTDRQFLAMQSAKNADGSAMYPGMQGKSLDDLRTLWKGQAQSLSPSRPDGAPIVP